MANQTPTMQQSFAKPLATALALQEAAKAAPLSEPAPPAAEPAAPATPAPAAVASAPLVAPPVEPVVEPPAQPVTPPQTFKVRADGEDLDVPLEELLRGYSRTATFTKRTQQLSDERRALDTAKRAMEEREGAVAAFLADRERVAQYNAFLQSMQPGQPTAPQPPAPQEPLTWQTAEQLLLQRFNQLDTVFNKKLQTFQEDFDKKQKDAEVSAHARNFRKLTDQIVEQHPVLKKAYTNTDELFELIRKDAGQAMIEAQQLGEDFGLDPAEYARQALIKAAQNRASRLGVFEENARRLQAMQQPAQARVDTEPPGVGSPVPVARKPMKLGSPDMLKHVMSKMGIEE